MEEIIKELLRINNLTFKELSKKIGMTEAGLYSTLKKNTIKVEMLQKIASFFNVHISYFFDTSNEILELNAEVAGLEAKVDSSKVALYQLILNTDNLLSDIKEYCEKNDVDLNKFLEKNNSFKSINQYAFENRKVLKKEYERITSLQGDMGSGSGS